MHGANGANNLAIGLNAMDDTDAGSPSLSSDENVFIGHNAGGGTWVNNKSRFNSRMALIKEEFQFVPYLIVQDNF